jgi:hypothetical protein
VIFCRGDAHSTDGDCVDLVVDLELAVDLEPCPDLEPSPDWRITDVRYWGFPSHRWHLGFDADAALADQLTGLAQSLPSQLA